MKKAVTGFATAAAFAAFLSLPALAQAGESQANIDKGEAELAKILEGRVAGTPVKCLSSSKRDGLQVVDQTALVFRDGRTLYVNRTNSPRSINDFDVPVFKSFGSSLCNLDQVEFRDRTSLMPGPVAILTEFVPYTKTDEGG